MPQNFTAYKPKILVFCRNYLVPDFHSNFDPLSDTYDIHYLTDQKCKYGTEDTRDSFYQYLDDSKRCAELDQLTEDDVIARCRLLRNLDRNQASKMAHAMAQVICDVYDKKRPDMLFTHMVDEYILHLFYIFAKRRNIAYAAYCGSYFPGHALIFKDAYGGALSFRSPEDEEVSQVLEAISPTTFRQNYRQVKQYSFWQHARLMLRYFAKRVVFPVKSYFESDPWGMHFKIVPFCADRKSFNDFPDKNNFVINWQDELAELRRVYPQKKVIYLPLAYFPEATTNYWIENKSIIDYDNKIVEIIKTLSLDFIVLVKEHAHMMGARNVALHKGFKTMNSVISIHPDIIGNEVLQASDAVILGGGSAGVEAFLRGKPVFSYCNNSYWFPYSKAAFLNLDNLDKWSEQIQDILPNYISAISKEKLQFIHDCLQCTARTKAGGKRWPLLLKDDLNLLIRYMLTRKVNDSI